jgi:hypothetical protein
VPLEQFGSSAMEAIAAYWAARPARKKTGRFVQWLNSSLKAVDALG